MVHGKLPSPQGNSGEHDQALSHSPFSDTEWRGVIEVLNLSPRQAEVVCGILAAQTERSIAEQLGVSQDTVHSHTRRLYAKLKTHNRSATIVRVFSAYANLGDAKKPAAHSLSEADTAS